MGNGQCPCPIRAAVGRKSFRHRVPLGIVLAVEASRMGMPHSKFVPKLVGNRHAIGYCSVSFLRLAEMGLHIFACDASVFRFVLIALRSALYYNI